ncbi:hypothetical protein DC498_22000 [Terrimonas sp.]|uniref:hypothetical protein n=1 Tax=Terrimonas sp. TaxID=1914338 RepID=UPI000D51482A|nr:hypothetical protein [Terrimonas sp.]PVD49997.1 hypothetical protein DC498_22000 [Terrimonas sp.]
MSKKSKQAILEDFGAFLKKHREDVLKEKNLLQFSYSTNFDNSKLAKIEKGEVDIRFKTLLEIFQAYKLSDTNIIGFKFKL